MRRRFSRWRDSKAERSPLRVYLALLLTVLVLGSVSSVESAKPVGSAGPLNPAASASVGPLEPRSAFLLATSTSVSPGTGEDYQLTITGVNCNPSAPPNETVVSISFSLGDGFQ